MLCIQSEASMPFALRIAPLPALLQLTQAARSGYRCRVGPKESLRSRAPHTCRGERWREGGQPRVLAMELVSRLLRENAMVKSVGEAAAGRARPRLAVRL